MKIVSKKAFINGKIFTSNDNQPWAQSCVTEGNRILFVGSDIEAEKYFDADTEFHDLAGDLMLPGFIDSHLHFMTGGFSLMNADFADVKSKEEFQCEVQKFISAQKRDWIEGGNWDNNKFDDNSLPVKEWVDSITGDIPLFVTRSDLHMGLANSKALSLAGITKETPNPDGGIIMKDNLTGEPTGILVDSAMKAVLNILPEPTEEERIEALELAMKEANKFGITSVHDIVFPKDYTVYDEYMKDRKLTCRINLIRPITELDVFKKSKIRFADGDEFLQVGALKAFADGSLGSSTALFFEPYSDDPKTCGLAMSELKNGKLREWALEADRNKLQLVIHAIGDRAVAEVLDIYEEIVSTNPKWDRRFRLEHVQHIRKEDIERMSKLGVIASMQPYHLFFDGAWCENKIGTNRIAGTYAIKSLHDAGVVTCFGSDWTVVSMNPMQGTFTAATRLVEGAKSEIGWNPREKIDVKEAVKSYTINAAYASFDEKIKGSIEKGKLADLVILSDNIFEISPCEIKNVSVKKTICDGEIVFNAED